ncbi:peptidylprolyl isomerase [Limnovirga soli]|uniref:peptidylprolyl isomerase n=1 Tax=Limnovirga soli TaxID=2656915 RepID=A0A8J8FM93_9BACT|nr:peptidylprolyl isomerase [Limnovirga soli]NNV57489.1 peptidylprolyl isomerase [Limnovirga soli]
MKQSFFLLAALLLLNFAHAQNKPVVKPKPATGQKVAPIVKERLVQVTTDYGTMIIKLYNETPQHRDNFISKVKAGFFDSLLFHRIIQEFMIQGGDPDSKYAPDGQMLGAGDAPGGRIPQEFNTKLIHKKGVLAAARDNNPEKASSNCQFYIVQGKKCTDIEINQVECNIRSSDPAFTYTTAQRNIYKTIGGVPFLDQNYTVFGEVTKGLEVIDKIAALPKDGSDRPLQNVRFKMKMLN